MAGFSFEKGYVQLSIQQRKEVKKEVMDSLNLKSRRGWSDRLRGIVEPKISEYRKIESIFKKRGIKDIWS